jgi:hypothetical protein
MIMLELLQLKMISTDFSDYQFLPLQKCTSRTFKPFKKQRLTTIQLSEV